jgi:LppP/LprE lipoprotein
MAWRHIPKPLLCGIGLLLCVIPIRTLPGQSAGKSWLDEPLHTWNRPGGEIPKAPPRGVGVVGMCQDSVRKPSGPEDRAVMTAGWLLVGPLQTFSGTTVILAESNADGMCRPLGYQVFVFVDGQFAGTVSPVPMNSRTDGTMDPFELSRPDELDIAFSRYKASDPLCCASGQTFVSYEIKRVEGRPLLVPSSLHTSASPKI